MKTLGNLNGENGQTGALRTVQASQDVTVVEAHGGRVLELDPAAAGGAITVTLSEAPGGGFFVELVQVSSGSVSVVASAGTTLHSPGGLTSLAGEWAAATLRRRDGSGGWVLNGELA